MAERQTNYTIGEGMELPSRGLIYSKPQSSFVELRSMTARDEMKRLSPSSSQFRALADIIEGCMIEKPAIHVYDMALGDYEYLLHRLRIVTYGDEYNMTLRCPFCGEYFDTAAHLEELQIREFDKEIWDSYKSVQLPKSGDTVTLRFQTPRMLDENEAKTKEMKRKYRDAEIDFATMVLLTSIIETVNGQTLDELRLESYVNKLPALDMLKIVNRIDAMNDLVGVESSLIVTCGKCGGEVPTNFRFGPEFFRPTNI
jgi:hypothetical protein